MLCRTVYHILWGMSKPFYLVTIALDSYCTSALLRWPSYRKDVTPTILFAVSPDRLPVPKSFFKIDVLDRLNRAFQEACAQAAKLFYRICREEAEAGISPALGRFRTGMRTDAVCNRAGGGVG